MTTTTVVCAIRHVEMFARFWERQQRLCLSGFGCWKAPTACEKAQINARNQIRVERQSILAIENGKLDAAERKFDFENTAGYFGQRKIDFGERNFDLRKGSMVVSEADRPSRRGTMSPQGTAEEDSASRLRSTVD